MLNERGINGLTASILDCNLWITNIIQEHSLIRDLILSKNIQVIVTSYMVGEILRVIKRLALWSGGCSRCRIASTVCRAVCIHLAITAMISLKRPGINAQV